MKYWKQIVCILLCLMLAGCTIKIPRPDHDTPADPPGLDGSVQEGTEIIDDPEMPAMPTGVEDTSPCGYGVHDYAPSGLKEPTCEEDGYCEYTCKYCEVSYTEPYSALGHDFDKSGICRNCQGKAEGAAEYIIFHDPYLENYVKQTLGIASSEQVSLYTMRQLKAITVDTGVKDVQDLQYAVNLESFTLNTSNVQNLGVLCELPVLRSISFRMNMRVDITFMKDMKHLTYVGWHSAELTGGDISYLVASPELTSLYFYGSAGNGIDFLEGADMLEDLVLWHAYSYDDNIDVLLRLPSLKTIEILTYQDLPDQQDEVFRQLMARGVSIKFI